MMASSKSFKSKTTSRCGVPYIPKLLTCASPSITTGIPLIGNVERSAAMTHADPRRKANGEAAMRPIRRGTNCACLPLLLSASSFKGSVRFFPGFHSACDSRGTVPRSALPSARRCSHETILLPKSNFRSGSIFAIATLPPISPIGCIVFPYPMHGGQKSQ